MATDNNRPAGEGNDGGKGGRRRYFRRRKRKGDEPTAAPAKERPAAPAASANAASSSSAASTSSTSGSRRTGPRGNRPPRDERGRSGGNNNSNNNNNNSNNGNRPRRRRRRSRQEQPNAVATVSESTLDAIAHDYVAPKSVFIYTHVSRPANQGMSEYRAEHFTKGGRRLEDFSIDLSILFGDNKQKGRANEGELAEGEVRKKSWQEEWEDAGREEIIAEPVTPPAPEGENADTNEN